MSCGVLSFCIISRIATINRA